MSWYGMVHLSCTATVGGEEVTVRQSVVQAVYDDPIARDAVEQALREALVRSILDKWKPKIHMRTG